MFALKNSCDGAYSSIDVRFTRYCDNKCPMCIERFGIRSLGRTKIDKLLESIKNANIKDVLILGGEPLLFVDELLAFVKMLRPLVEKIYVTTSLPITFVTQYDTILKICKYIDGLNVSLQDATSCENNKLLNASSDHNRLRIITRLLSDVPEKIRVHINLIKGHVDSKIKLESILDWLYHDGCRCVKINELQHAPDLYISYEEITGSKLKSPYSHGCQTEEIFPKYEKMKVIIKRSCFKVEKSRKAGFVDLLKALYICLYPNTIHKNKYVVIYENGEISQNWKRQIL